MTYSVQNIFSPIEISFHSLLLEKGVCENHSSDSSLFVTIVPRRFELCANNEASLCLHALNFSKLITYRSSLLYAVGDTVFNMARNARISCIKESLLKETLSLNNLGSDDRGDIHCDWIDNSEAIVANDTLVHRRKLNPVSALDFKTKEKHRKYAKAIEEANADRNTQLVYIVFPFSLNRRISVETGSVVNDFHKMVQEKIMKRFDISVTLSNSICHY
ncbi:hypothetical protein P9112_004882 [Eukaryota sp. TZLM1-RC]